MKALLNTDAFDDAVKRKRVAEAAKEVGNALFKFTYLKKANDTEGTLDTAQSAIGNTLRSLLLQLKPGPMLKRNLTPAAVIAAEMERPVPLTPTPTLPTQTMPVAPVSPSSPAAKNEDILKSIQEVLTFFFFGLCCYVFISSRVCASSWRSSKASTDLPFPRLTLPRCSLLA